MAQSNYNVIFTFSSMRLIGGIKKLAKDLALAMDPTRGKKWQCLTCLTLHRR